MKKKLIKDLTYRQKFKKQEKSLFLFGVIKANKFLPKSYRLKAKRGIADSNIYTSKFNNRCVVSGRARGLIREFKVSRIVFKELVNSGYFPGIKKSSW